jgi:hypothetical protein
MGSHGLMPALSGVPKLLFSVDLYAGIKLHSRHVSRFRQYIVFVVSMSPFQHCKTYKHFCILSN